MSEAMVDFAGQWAPDVGWTVSARRWVDSGRPTSGRTVGARRWVDRGRPTLGGRRAPDVGVAQGIILCCRQSMCHTHPFSHTLFSDACMLEPGVFGVPRLANQPHHHWTPLQQHVLTVGGVQGCCTTPRFNSTCKTRVSAWSRQATVVFGTMAYEGKLHRVLAMLMLERLLWAQPKSALLVTATYTHA